LRVAWIFILTAAVYSAAGYVLEKSGKVSGTTLKIAGVVL
jgi:hypothetical protein